MDKAPLVDTYARHLKYLRISVTDRCNLRCSYCMPRELIPKLTHDDILTYEEILRVVSIGTRMGITKVRVTGGEPLIRKGIFGFLKSLGTIPELEDLSLTTNGVTLEKHLDQIKKMKFGSKQQAQNYMQRIGLSQSEQEWMLKRL